jgi:hypothetical protein
VSSGGARIVNNYFITNTGIPRNVFRILETNTSKEKPFYRMHN